MLICSDNPTQIVNKMPIRSYIKEEPPKLSLAINRNCIVPVYETLATDNMSRIADNIASVISGEPLSKCTEIDLQGKETSTIFLKPKELSDAVFKVPQLSPRRLIVKHKIAHDRQDSTNKSLQNTSTNIFKTKKIKRMKTQKSKSRIIIDSSTSKECNSSYKMEACSEAITVPTESTSTNVPENKVKNIDLANITKYFGTPQLIEPILDFDLDLLLFGSSSDSEHSDNDETNEVSKDSTLLEKSNNEIEYSLLTNKVGIETDSVQENMAVKADIQSSLTLIDFNLHTSIQSDITSVCIASPSEYFSPASPTNEDLYDQEYTTVEIPVHSTEQIIPAVTKIIQNYSQQKHKAIEQINESHPEVNNKQLYATLRNVVEQYLTDIWTSSSLKTCTCQLLLLTIRPKLLASCLLEIIEDTDELLTEQRYIPAPALSDSHQKVLVLIHHLSTTKLPRFSEYCSLQVERSLFTLTNNKTAVTQIINLTRLFIGINDTSFRKPRIRQFLYKCIYYFQHLSIPMVFTVLLAYPDCLPVLQNECDSQPFTEAFSQFDPIVQAIHIILMNTNYTVPLLHENYTENYKKRELYSLLKSYYRYPMTRHSYDMVLTNLVDRLKQNNLHNISYSFILIAKRNGIQWARSKLIDQTLVTLLKHFLGCVHQTDEHDGQIETILITIGSIIKTFPITEDINNFYQIFVSIMESTPSDRQKIQEAAVSALLQTSRFGIVNVYQRICNWQPPFKISRKLLCQLQTFVHRKKLSYWKR